MELSCKFKSLLCLENGAKTVRMTVPFLKSLLTPELLSCFDGGWYHEEDSIIVLTRVISHRRNCSTERERERERQNSKNTFGKIWFQYKIFALWLPFKETKYKSDDFNSSISNLFAESQYRIVAICLLTPGFLRRSSLLLILSFKLLMTYWP
jgi:hypothetical protein